MIYLELFLAFLEVGCFSFGGAYSAIPLIRDVVLRYGWLTDEQLSYMIAVSESTPGPIMVNLATYIGSAEGGLLGALIATFSVVLPAFLIIIILLTVLKNAWQNVWFQAVLRGLKACVIGIILAVGGVMAFQNALFSTGALSFELRPILLTVVLSLVLWLSKPIFKKKIPPLLFFGVSAVLGVVAYAF